MLINLESVLVRGHLRRAGGLCGPVDCRAVLGRVASIKGGCVTASGPSAARMFSARRCCLCRLPAFACLGQLVVLCMKGQIPFKWVRPDHAQAAATSLPLLRAVWPPPRRRRGSCAAASFVARATWPRRRRHRCAGAVAASASLCSGRVPASSSPRGGCMVVSVARMPGTSPSLLAQAVSASSALAYARTDYATNFHA